MKQKRPTFICVVGMVIGWASAFGASLSCYSCPIKFILVFKLDKTTQVVRLKITLHTDGLSRGRLHYRGNKASIFSTKSNH